MCKVCLIFEVMRWIIHTSILGGKILVVFVELSCVTCYKYILHVFLQVA
jgi:hypothetical protein